METFRKESQARSQDFLEGGLHKHARVGGSGGMLPQENVEIRCSEIASEAILGQKQSRSSYMARGELHPIFGCPHDFEFPREKLLRLAEQQLG